MKNNYHVMNMLLVVVVVCVGIFIYTNTQSNSFTRIEILQLNGEAIIERPSVGHIHAFEEMRILKGDKIVVSSNSTLRLIIDDKKIVFVDENTILKIEGVSESKNSRVKIVVEAGNMIEETSK